MVVVRFLFELQGPTVDEKLGELVRQVHAQFIQGYRHFPVHYFFVFLLFAIGFEVLPGQCSLYEVQQNVHDTFNIVSPRLLDAQVGVE